MNLYTVNWTDDALNELASLWLQASDPDEMTRAQATIDTLLARAPLHHGEAVREGLRRLIVPPLRVLYTVDTSARHVEVASVKPAS
jgi:hypothetical protein